MKTFTLLLLLFFNLPLIYSQITNIPDIEFEQALIDQNIDSDGVINGQVLTSDIDNLNALNLGFYLINDLTGLQDFAQLQNFTIDNLDLSNNTNQSLDLTANTMLETLIMNGGDDALTHFLEKIDLSENPNINQIYTTGIWPLKQLDLKTGNTDVSNLDINITISPLDLMREINEAFSDELFCIKVTDEVAATANTGVYSTWTITADNNPYYFSETCTLGTNKFDENDISIYPNPASNTINIKSNNIQLNSVKIYNLQGQLVNEFKALDTNVFDISELASGLYVIHIKSNTGIVKKKLIKQ